MKGLNAQDVCNFAQLLRHGHSGTPTDLSKTDTLDRHATQVAYLKAHSAHRLNRTCQNGTPPADVLIAEKIADLSRMHPCSDCSIATIIEPVAGWRTKVAVAQIGTEPSSRILLLLVFQGS